MRVEIKIQRMDRRGIHRFNAIVNVIQRNRQVTVSQDMEEKLKSKYAISLHNGVEEDKSEFDSDNDDLDELNCYDGFGGDMELDRATNEDNGILVQLEGVTNYTPV